ncbi:MAG: cyclic nucleotide-binding domain-containing protein [Bdellovibrionales bacterium]|nr:cyclic nucleotide-binding domain-containing protein [Bdellovibrionales bacterium]
MSINPEKIKEMSYKSGDYILREGAMCDSLIVVKSGQIEVFRKNARGEKVILGLVQSGEYLGEMSLISDKPHSANAVALTDVKCLWISSEAIDHQLKDAPKWLLALTRGLVMKLARTNEILRRNGIQDEHLYSSIKAIESKEDAKKINLKNVS